MEEWSKPIEKPFATGEISLGIYSLPIYSEHMEKEPGRFFVKQLFQRKEEG